MRRIRRGFQGYRVLRAVGYKSFEGELIVITTLFAIKRIIRRNWRVITPRCLEI
jgi:hypothetical protein